MDSRLELGAVIRRGVRMYEVGDVNYVSRNVSLLNLATGFTLQVPVVEVVSPEYLLVRQASIPTV
jgi:hypothetical protein